MHGRRSIDGLGDHRTIRPGGLDEALTLAQQADDLAQLGEVWAVRGMALHTDYLAERATELTPAAPSFPILSTVCGLPSWS